MGRSLGVHCAKDAAFLTIAVDGELVHDDKHDKLSVATGLEETERLRAMKDEVGRMLAEVKPDCVRILLPEQTYKDSYTRIAPRVTLETLVRLACLEAKLPVEMLRRVSARSRLGLPKKGKLDELIAGRVEPVGRYWNAGRNAAAAAALADD